MKNIKEKFGTKFVVASVIVLIVISFIVGMKVGKNGNSEYYNLMRKDNDRFLVLQSMDGGRSIWHEMTRGEKLVEVLCVCFQFYKKLEDAKVEIRKPSRTPLEVIEYMDEHVSGWSGKTVEWVILHAFWPDYVKE
jgi:hypothetical protein